MAPRDDEVENIDIQKKNLETCDFDSIQFLLKAPSREVVKKILQDCYDNLNLKVPEHFVHKTSEDLAIPSEDASKMISAIKLFLKEALFEGHMEPRELHPLFPDDFHKSLRELLSKLIAEKMQSWKSDAISRQVSLPRLVDFDWRIDVKTASSGKMSIPSCLLQLKVDSNMSSGHVTRDETKSLNVELTKETLDTMLDGLGKIRDQLNSVVAR